MSHSFFIVTVDAYRGSINTIKSFNARCELDHCQDCVPFGSVAGYIIYISMHRLSSMDVVSFIDGFNDV